MKSFTILLFLGLGHALPQPWDWEPFNFEPFNFEEAEQHNVAEIEATLPVGDSRNGCHYNRVRFTCRKGPGQRIYNTCRYFSMNYPQCLTQGRNTANLNCQPCCLDPGRSGLEQCTNFVRNRRDQGPPPQELIELTSTGVPSIMYSRKIGQYYLQNDLPNYNGFPTFKKVNSGQTSPYIFVQSTNDGNHFWAMSNRIGGMSGGSFGLYNPSTPVPGTPPPTSGWKYRAYWIANDRSYHSDPDMRLNTVNNSGCPSNAQRGLGCSDNGTCNVWCCETGQGTPEIPACSTVFGASETSDYNYEG